MYPCRQTHDENNNSNCNDFNATSGQIFWPSMKQGTLSILFVKDTSSEWSCGFGVGEGKDLDVGEIIIF